MQKEINFSPSFITTQKTVLLEEHALAVALWPKVKHKLTCILPEWL